MKNKLLLLSLLMVTLVLQFACKKNSASGPPVINSVRSLDSTKRDSFFVRAVPGALIAIQGSNFSGLQAVIFNDTAAYFNPAYCTDNTIIVTIPGTAQTAAINPNVPNTLKVVTDHGTAVYTFTLYLYPPVITSIAFDNSGTLVYINGSNFQGVKKIQFPLPPGFPDTALSYTVNKAYTQITAVIPPGTALKDSLRVTCTFGKAAFSYPPPMTITSVSNENGGSGTTITVNGTNFIGISKVIFPGGLLGTNIQSLSVNQFSVTVPNGITTTDSLRIQGGLGTAVSPQLFASCITHPSPSYLCNFDNQWGGDNQGFVGWTGGYADAPTAATNYPGATGGVAVLLQSSPMSANAGPTSQGNAGLLQLNDFPWVSNTATAISGYSMKFEVYVKTAWSKGQIWIAVGDWYGWSSYTARYNPWTASAAYQPVGWVTVTIPLSQFITGNQFWQTTWNTAGAAATKFSDYPTTGVAFCIANDVASAVPANSINIAIDNVRIVKGQ